MKTKSRGNGQGLAYKRPGCSTWTACAVVGWRPSASPDKPSIPIKRTKAAALAYCLEMRPQSVPRPQRISLFDIQAVVESIK